MLPVCCRSDQLTLVLLLPFEELHVFCELYSCLVDVEELKKHALTGIILSGGPNSVYDEGAPHVQPGVWKLIEDLKLPVLGASLPVAVLMLLVVVVVTVSEESCMC